MWGSLRLAPIMNDYRTPGVILIDTILSWALYVILELVNIVLLAPAVKV